MVSIVASGLCTIVAAQTGGTSGGIVYATAAPVSQSFTIRTGQVITFAQPADIDASAAPFSLGATTSSPLTVSYTTSTPSVCTVTSAGVVTLLTYGTCTITATQSGGVSGGVTYAAATSVTRSFESRRAQTITFTLATPINRVYTSGDFAVSATSFSTLPVTFSSSTPSICTVTGSTVSMVTVGTCTVVAAQSGGVSGGITYAAAPEVARSFNALGVPQTITFPAIPPKRDYDADFPLPATASSGLAVTYVTNNTSVCTIVPTRRLHIYGMGTCIVTASQAGGPIGGVIYAAAPSMQQTFVITDETPTPSRTATRTPTITNTPTNTATRTPTPPGVQLKKAAIGASFTLGLLMNGTLITWGMNKEFQTNIPPCCGSNIDDIAVGTNFAVALKGGRVFGWGANSRGQITIPKSANANIVSIAAGYAHVLAVNKAGTVIAWGNNESGQTKVPKSLRDVTSVAAGTQHSIALKKDTTIVIWGRNAEKQAVIPAGLRGVRAASGGFDHTMVLKTDGTVLAWGANAFGQSKVPDNVRDIKQISAGSYYSLALGNNGTVYAWGRNDNKQIDIPKGYNDIAVVGAGYVNTVIGLRDGRVLALGAAQNDALVSRTPTKTATPTP
jgi:alpha-tubulin suppressor-like RCC1 family protein